LQCLSLVDVERRLVAVLADLEVILVNVLLDDFAFASLALHELFATVLPRSRFRIERVRTDLDHAALTQTVVFAPVVRVQELVDGAPANWKSEGIVVDGETSGCAKHRISKEVTPDFGSISAGSLRLCNWSIGQDCLSQNRLRKSHSVRQSKSDSKMG